MPELLVFLHDHKRTTPDHPFEKQLLLPRPGDLITWQEDGWEWGTVERMHPWFRPLRWPGADRRELDVLLHPNLLEADMDEQPTVYRLYRGYYLNLRRLLAINDLSGHQVAAYTVQRPRVPLPAVRDI